MTYSSGLSPRIHSLPEPGRDKILLLSRNSPSPANSGGSQRVNLLYRALMQHGEVGFVGISWRAQDGTIVGFDLSDPFQLAGTVFLDNVAGIDPDRSPGPLSRWLGNLKLAIRRRTDWFKVNPQARDAIAQIVEKWRPSMVVCRHLDFALALGLVELAQKTGFSLMVDVDDVPWEVWQTEQKAASPMRPDQRFRQIVADHLARREILRAAAGIDVLCVSKPADRRFFRHFDCHVVRNIPFKAPAASADVELGMAPRPRHILMVGSYTYQPNADAAEWFVRHVWPTVRTRVTDARLIFVGLDAARMLGPLLATCDRIEAISDVADTSTYYAQSMLAISPVRTGSGTKIKVLEALAHGVPCVATRHSAQGYEGEFHGLLVGNSPTEFADCCVEVLQRPAPAFTRAARDQARVRHNWSFEAFCKQVETAACAAH